MSESLKETTRAFYSPGWLLVEVISLVAMGATVALPTWHYASLPEQVPMHFDATGQPDNYGPRAMIWLLPAVAAMLWTGLSVLSLFPHVYNYPYTLTDENRARQHRNARQMVITLKMLVTLLFASIVWQVIETALGRPNAIANWVFVGVLVSVFLVVGFFIWRGARLQ